MGRETDPEHWRRVDELVARALDLPEGERTAFVERECAEDAELGREALELLRGAPQLGAFLDPDSAPIHAAAGPSDPEDPWLGRNIDGFEVRGVIGTGGMGCVYEAWQSPPGRKVAVKVISRRFARAEDLRRFEHEGSVLAKLGHPNIAHLYASGLVEDPWDAQERLPYLAMELVEGARPLTDFAREEQLDHEARIRLFLDVCDGVHHAHQRGVLHRDLKPSNILVDADGRPKIIDFGIARSADRELEDEATLTQRGQLVGTLQYMSPQQLGETSDLIDVRSDVYSLGMVLYELATDARPYDLSTTTLYEAIRIIREDAPTRPSEHQPSCRGDLETILLKALHKDPDQRFASVHELREDLRRYLERQPITARPPTFGYRARLFARRNPLAAAALVAAVLFFVGGAVTSTVLLIRERRATRSSERQQRVAEAISGFLREDLLGAADPYENPDPDLRVRDVLDRAAEKVEGQFADEPLVEAGVRKTIGTSYYTLGMMSAAQPQFERALDLFERELGPRHEEALSVRRVVVVCLTDAGRFEEADQALRPLQEAVAAGAGQEALPWLMAEAEATLARRRGRPAEALPLLVRARRYCDEVEGRESLGSLTISSIQASILRELDRLDEAAALQEENLELSRKHYSDGHPRTVTALAELALIRQDQGRYDEACSMLEEAVERGVAVWGPDKYGVLMSQRNLALGYQLAGRIGDAQRVIEPVYEACLASLGSDHYLTQASGIVLGSVTTSLGDCAKAEEVLSATLAACERTVDTGHPRCLETALTLARAQAACREYEAAMATLEVAIEAADEPDEGQRETLLALMNQLGQLKRQTGNPEEAAVLLGEVAGRMQEWLGTHVGTAASLMHYGSCLHELGREDEAEAALLESHRIAAEIFGADHGNTRGIAKKLAEVYEAQGRGEEARALRSGSGPE